MIRVSRLSMKLGKHSQNLVRRSSKDLPLKGAMECFQTQRAVGLRGLGIFWKKLFPTGEVRKDTATWNIEKGFGLTIEYDSCGSRN